nr:MATE family efflux transporter [uncultured Bacteroides sp.]
MLNIVITINNKIFNTDARSSKMRKNTIVMIGIRGVSILVSLLSAPIMLHHVNRADYGVLLTLTSVVSWVSMMDIGLGNGLRNKLSGYIAEGDINSAKKAVSSCYAALLIYVGVLILIFLASSSFINWKGVLNSPSSDAGEIMRLANIVFIAFSIQFLFGLLNSILYAYQLPALQSFFLLIGQILAFIMLFLQVYIFDVTSVFQIGAVNCLVPPLVLFIGSIVLFAGRLKEIAPTFKMIELKSVNSILSLGVKFFILQIISIVLFQANSIIIARSVGPEAVVEYNLAFKYISVLTMIFNIVITPIWSATTDAYVRKDYEWIKKTISYTRKVSLASIAFGCFMVFFSKPIYNFWLGENTIDISYSTSSLVLLYLSFDMLYKVYGTIINGVGKVYAQMIITGCIAICYIPFAFLLGKSMGLTGVLIANSVVFFFNYVWSKIQCKKIVNKTATGIWDK